jgi:hypothetical protein
MLLKICWFVLLQISMAEETFQECNFIAAGWTKVRWTVSTTWWYRPGDWLAGTATYSESDSESVNFDSAVPDWDMYLLSTGDF